MLLTVEWCGLVRAASASICDERAGAFVGGGTLSNGCAIRSLRLIYSDVRGVWENAPTARVQKISQPKIAWLKTRTCSGERGHLAR
jgi:hypothetical protein